MKGTIEFIATKHIQQECIGMIKNEFPQLEDDLHWESIIKKVTQRIYDSKYFENKGDLCIRVKESNNNQNPVAFQDVWKNLKVTPRMIVKLYGDNDDIVIASFFSSIGHERGHDNDYKLALVLQFLEGFLPSKCKEFERIASYPNEVYADYYSCSKWLNGDVDLFIDCVNYKLGENKKIKEQKISNTHPTWKQRIDYLQMRKFDKDLIHTILKDTGCKNNKIIDKYTNKLFNHYCKKSPNNDVISDILLI